MARSYLDAPRGYWPLLTVGRTTPLLPRVDMAEVLALEAQYPKYPYDPKRMGHCSVVQRLDLIATSMLAQSMEDEKGHNAKKDILTKYKAWKFSKREIPVPDPDVFSGYNPDVDRKMIEMTVDHHAQIPHDVVQNVIDTIEGVIAA